MTKLPNDQRSASDASERTFTGSVTTQSSVSSSNPDLARVFVKLENGYKIVVPTPQTSSVHSVHTHALRRAAMLDFTGTLSDTFLRTTGNDPVVLFGEDSLIDVLDFTEDNTFSLGSLDRTLAGNTGSSTSSSTPQPTNPAASSSGVSITPAQVTETPQTQQDGAIHVQWITLEAAMGYSRLRKIPVDKAISLDTTLAEFHNIAVQRVCGKTPRGSCTKSSNLNLFPKECRLYTENNFATLRELRLSGTKHEPLDIFVEFIGSEPRTSFRHLSLSTEPKKLWSFDSTKRGMSTFVTSLQVLLKEIGKGHCSLDEILEVLLELTHFPPLLLAFRTVHETGLDSGTSVDSLLLIASAIYALCGSMVPSSICPTTDTFLESSRQIICWISSLRAQTSLSRATNQLLLHRVQVTKPKEDAEMTPPFMPFNEIEIPNSSDPAAGKKKLLVSIEKGDKALSQRLGLALHDKSASPWDFYFQAAESWQTLWNHKILPLLTKNEFESLMETTNNIEAFKMVGPLQDRGLSVRRASRHYTQFCWIRLEI